VEIRVFLFTDIEASTQRWAGRPDLMRDALRRHDALLTAAITDSGGCVFKHTGDGMVAVFDSVHDAVVSATDGQRRLVSTDWGQLPELRVRMAIHAGEAEARGGDWYGPALNRVARLTAVGHGGQILLSSAAQALVAERLPDGVGLSDLGEHRLRDLLHPERVFQVTALWLHGAFPPLRSMNAAKGNLPIQLTSFVGREVEMDALGGLVLGHRLTTVIGPGGMGKTRLAVHTAAALADKFPDGVWFVDLTPVQRGESVDVAAAAALEVDLRGTQGARDVVIRAFRHGRALIVLDNCEHVADPAAELVESLALGCPAVSVLATSREPLHVAGEHVYLLGPLTVDETGVELFVDRARSARHGFDPDDLGRRLIVEICQRLDGMPLAIELAAARTRSMTVAELAGRLDDRFRVLRSGRGGTGRHGTLTAVVEWSYDQLTPAERQLLDRLSIFAGGFDLRAAHAVCAPQGSSELDTLDHLDALVERSLLVAEDLAGTTRYRLLETIRQYSAGRLDAEIEDALADSHARYYAGIASAGRHQQRIPLQQETANLRAAVNRALEKRDVDLALQVVGPLWTHMSVSLTLIEAEDWARAALSLPGADSHPDAYWTHMLLAFAFVLRARFVDAECHARSAIGIAQRFRSQHEARAWRVLADALFFQGRFRESRNAGARGARVAASHGRAAAEVECLYHVVQSFVADDGDVPPGTLRRMAEVADRSGNPVAQAWALYSHALAVSRADPKQAADLLDETRSMAEPLGMRVLATACQCYGAYFAHGDDPIAALGGLAVVLNDFAGHRLPLELRVGLRDALPAMGQLGWNLTVAICDGAAGVVSQRPAAVRRAITHAREAVGNTAYEAAMQRGRAMTDGELEVFLRVELASLRSREQPLA
jgi:predicted ATPase/class 3 adenylate cyclase